MHTPFAFHTDLLESPLHSLRHRRSRTPWLRPRTCTLFTSHVDVAPPDQVPAAPLTMGQFLTFRSAIAFARRAHAGQRRLDGRAYLSHPLAVLQILLTASQHLPQDAYIAGLLHDTVEDGQARLEHIHAEFGEDVATAVDALTRPERPHKADRRAHEEAYLARMIQVNAQLPYVLIIKMADRLHNLETAHFLPVARKDGLHHETLTLFLPLILREEANQTSYSDAYRMLTELLERSLMNLSRKPVKGFTL